MKLGKTYGSPTAVKCQAALYVNADPDAAQNSIQNCANIFKTIKNVGKGNRLVRGMLEQVSVRSSGDHCARRGSDIPQKPNAAPAGVVVIRSYGKVSARWQVSSLMWSDPVGVP